MRFILAALIFSSSGLAQAEEGINLANTAWVLTATALVLLMTLPGLSLFYGGLVRSKNVLSILMQCFTIACLASVIWFAVAYSIAFTEGNNFIGDMSRAFLSGITEDSLSGDIPETLFVMFQMTFAIITPALVVGAFAERIKFLSVVIFSALWLVLVYAPVTHWVWGGGWLADMGLLDFAGGTVVHVTAGVAALVAALMIGNRKGYGTNAMLPHNLTMTMTGAGLLWVGWFGFNAGSALAANGDATMAMLVTHLSAAMGALTWLSIEWIRYGKPSALGAATGMVAGLGTITPASGFVGPAGAIVIGLSAGFICFWVTYWMKVVVKIDDSLDVFPVHGVGGIIGSFLVGIFASDQLGIFSGQGLAEGVTISHQLYVQTVGILATGAYTALITYILFKGLELTIGLRSDDEAEQQGLDIYDHNESAYDQLGD